MTATIVLHGSRLRMTEAEIEIQVPAQADADKGGTIRFAEGQLWERAAEQKPATVGRVRFIAWKLRTRRYGERGPLACDVHPVRLSGVIKGEGK